MANKIEDFGRTIPGAAKHRAQAYVDRVRQRPDADFLSQPLSDVFPTPNYQALVDDGQSPLKIGYIRALREALPAKPRGRYTHRQMTSWFDQVLAMKQVTLNLLGDADTGDAPVMRIYDTLTKSPTAGNSGDILLGMATAYANLGHDRSLKDFSLYKNKLADGSPGYFYASRRVRFDAAGSIAAAADNMVKALSDPESQQSQLAQKKQKKPARPKFRVEFDEDRSVWLVATFGKISITLDKHADKEAATAWLHANYEEACARAAEGRQETRLRSDENAPRVGPRYRDGDVTPEDFQAMFLFSGVQFGKYVEGARRQEELNRTWDGLMDLADVLGVEPSSLSLGGELAIAFGARGRGGKGAAAAHYEPAQIVINLTKGNGAGCFAHEWFHALDNLMARSGGGRVGSYLSMGHSSQAGLSGLSVQMRETLGRHPVAQRSANLDRYRADDYYSLPEEMAARSFEALIKHRLGKIDRSNEWLANILDKEVYEALNTALGRSGDIYPFPHGDAEFEAIDLVMDRMIDTACKTGLLERRKFEPEVAPVAPEPTKPQDTGKIAVRQLSAKQGGMAGAVQMDLFAFEDSAPEIEQDSQVAEAEDQDEFEGIVFI